MRWAWLPALFVACGGASAPTAAVEPSSGPSPEPPAAVTPADADAGGPTLFGVRAKAEATRSRTRRQTRGDGSVVFFEEYASPRPEGMPAPEPAEKAALAFFSDAVRARASAEVTYAPAGPRRRFELEWTGPNRPCPGWVGFVDVQELKRPHVTKAVTRCDGEDLGREGNAVVRALGGEVDVSSFRHGTFAMSVVRVGLMRPRPSSDAAQILGEVGKALGAQASAYERVVVDAMTTELRPFRGGTQPCAGERIGLTWRGAHELELLFACDGQPAGHACGTTKGTCLGGLRCKYEEQSEHSASGTCVPGSGPDGRFDAPPTPGSTSAPKATMR